MTDLWPRLEPLLAAAERPARYLNHEFGCVYKPEADFRFCMVYPDTYELGQANQALRILVNVVNAVDGMAAERAFLPAPAMCDTLRAEGIPLFSIESCAPLAEFDAVGITLPHELAATNVLETLDLAGIPLHADERVESDPLVVGGGPCAYNPEPYAPFFDAFSIGEGEEALPRGLAVVRRLRAEGAARADILRALADEPGWYVPSLYRWRAEDEAQEAGSWIEPLEEGLPLRIEKSLFEGFAESPGWEPCIVPFTEVVHDRLNVEILRGCARGCRFCQAGMMYRPVRERSADNVVESVVQGLAETGYDEVSLTSLSSTDHSQIASILTRINRACDGKGVRISVPSQLSTIYVDSAELLSDYMEASAAHDKQKSSYKNFKTRYEEADVLLIDDVQYLQGKKQTLDIVFQIFNKLTSQGRQVVLSADRAPKNIDIDERYRSRFNSGGTFDIQPPEIETKLGIVKSFVDEYRESEGSHDFNIPDDIQMYIAESSSSNIRELKSAVTKVIYQMTFFNQPDLKLDDVRTLLENHFTGGPSKRLTIADIQKEVENFYKVSHADLVGKKRTRNIIYARQIAIYLCRQMLDLPFNDIGKKFNRDHSTVMYSVTNVEEKMKENRELREELEALRGLINEM